MSMTFASVKQVRIDSPFWAQRQHIARTQGIPYQLEALNDRLADAELSHCIQNFRIAAGFEQGEFHGFPFQDSDLAKWLEAVAFSLMIHPDAELEREADEIIKLIRAVQMPDGYLSTYYIINGIERRWTNLSDNHELYIAGHMIEAAVAYYQATGKRMLLDVCIRLADHIDSVFGIEEGKLRGYPGHPVIEMALVRLYEAVGDKKYLRLAKYFIDERGQEPHYFPNEAKTYGNPVYRREGYLGYRYYQADRPVRERHQVEGHAVRAVYLYCGMEDVARETQDGELHEVCKRLWKNLVFRNMYITGGIGSSSYGEAFTFDYDLPNDTAYAETCAAIGVVFWAQRMLRSEASGEYADVMERALYNGVISGMDLDGQRFFYVNPLEVVPEACKEDYLRAHVKPVRQKWFGCACCPPNLMRLLTSLGQYIYAADDETAYIHLYIGSRAELHIANQCIKLQMESEYPWNGRVCVEIKPEYAERFRVALRIPGWCHKYEIMVNGECVDAKIVQGYAYIDRIWQAHDRIELNLCMMPAVIRANTRVRENAGKVAVMRGPIVYCLEEVDNGEALHLLRISGKTKFTEQWEPELLNGIVTLSCDALRTPMWESEMLYTDEEAESSDPCTIRWIPYYAWANRGLGEMSVWIREVQ